MPLIPPRLRRAITLGKAKFFHLTMQMTLEPGEEVTMEMSPAALGLGPGVVWAQYGMTIAGVTFPDIRIGFWHSHRMMVYHWDPFVESIFNFPYYYNVATSADSPEVIILTNPTDTALTFNITGWIAEFPTKSLWREYVDVTRGEWNLLRELGRLSEEDVAMFVKGLANLMWVFSQFKRDELHVALARFLKIKLPWE